MERLGEKEQELYAEEHIKLVHYFAHKYKNLGIDYEERVGIAMIGLATALSTFNDSKGVKFSSYASRCIITELNKHAEKNKAKKRMTDSQIVSLDEPLNDGILLHELVGAPEKNVTLSEVYMTLNEVTAEMNERNQKIMRLFFDSYSQTEISKMLGCTPQNVSLIINGAFKEVKKRYWKENADKGKTKKSEKGGNRNGR